LKVSIITITYNSESTLIDTIDSVLNQTYKDIEYIIIDGKSTDSTVSIIHSYKDKISKFISEKDNGLYDALNKGIAMATGDIIGVLHSDDFYTNHQVIEKIVQTFNLNQADAVYADLFYVDKTNVDKILRKWKSGNYKHGMFVNGWMPPHPTFFVRRHCYEKYGSFNLDLVSAADYELMLRFVHKHQIKLAYLPEFIIKMRAGGLSNASLSNRIRANKEDRKAWLMNGLKPKFHTLYLKPLRKIIQLFKR
jgi:glycosyltransferase involved in cell wall biosynthesis